MLRAANCRVVRVVDNCRPADDDAKRNSKRDHSRSTCHAQRAACVTNPGMPSLAIASNLCSKPVKTPVPKCCFAQGKSVAHATGRSPSNRTGPVCRSLRRSAPGRIYPNAGSPFRSTRSSNLSAAPEGALPPCSHAATVAVRTFSIAANTAWLTFACLRICRMSAAV